MRTPADAFSYAEFLQRHGFTVDIIAMNVQGEWYVHCHQSGQQFTSYHADILPEVETVPTMYDVEMGTTRALTIRTVVETTCKAISQVTYADGTRNQPPESARQQTERYMTGDI